MKLKKASLILLFVCLFCCVTYLVYYKSYTNVIATSIGEKRFINKDIVEVIPKDMELKAPIYPKRSKYIMYCNLDGDKEKK
nr:hypothetical protein [Clostridium botulinum]